MTGLSKTVRAPEREGRTFELNREDAHRAHDKQDAMVEYINKGAMDSAVAALRAFILINGGAAAAVLAFVGGLVGQGKLKVDEHFAQISFSLAWRQELP